MLHFPSFILHFISFFPPFLPSFHPIFCIPSFQPPFFLFSSSLFFLSLPIMFRFLPFCLLSCSSCLFQSLPTIRPQHFPSFLLFPHFLLSLTLLIFFFCISHPSSFPSLYTLCPLTFCFFLSTSISPFLFLCRPTLTLSFTFPSLPPGPSFSSLFHPFFLVHLHLITFISPFHPSLFFLSFLTFFLTSLPCFSLSYLHSFSPFESLSVISIQTSFISHFHVALSFSLT